MAWRVARSLDELLRQLNTRYPTRSKASDGSIGDAAHSTTLSDHNPDAGGVVRARDFTHDPAAGVDIDRLSDQLAASRDPRIRYVIANSLIMSGAAGPRPWQWTAYRGNPHTKHLHLSVVADERADNPRTWDLPMLRQEDDMATPAEIWGHLLDDPYIGPDGKPRDRKPAHVLLSHGSANAAYAADRAARALTELAALRSALPDLIAEEIRTALADGVVDVDITVTNKTQERL